MTYYHEDAPTLTLWKKWRGLATVALTLLIVLGLIAIARAPLAPNGPDGEIVIPGEDWHGNVRRSDPTR
ncbi:MULTISPECIES: hypothetical protein [Roseobacteraceae]|uniref:Uncharacterized protein n=1 Tax=Pseudosulfitobacter pseudonitzschiae TaxID=1402135 RepID=A0A221K650_9RHOB|nr:MULTISPECIES: hypothetical protein [Roseobacteraceae]ASM74478.1 hypothetical protein SULPSESMR1_04782 [Pseudosulfitobacter pseudonitzschiae]